MGEGEAHVNDAGTSSSAKVKLGFPPPGSPRLNFICLGCLLRSKSLPLSWLQTSTHEWLHHVGEDLSHLVGLKNERDIKNHLQPVVEHYPDFRWAFSSL